MSRTKEYFNRLNADIPESGNSTADLLDELMFNLKWMITMQDPYDGGVYHKLTTPNFEGFVMPTDCHQQRYVVQKSVTASYDFAAVMALHASTRATKTILHLPSRPKKPLWLPITGPSSTLRPSMTKTR